MVEKELTVIELTEQNISSMVYEIRGQKIMLDFDLARIYGYATKRFNEQVKNNIEKFPEDFMFRLTNEELERVLRCQNVTTNGNLRSKKSATNGNLRSKFLTTEKSVIESEESSWSKKSTLNKSGDLRGYNVKYLPYAFTEQGIYMLMTVLKGELAVKQSKALIRLFKKMKDYIIENNQFLDYNASLINNKFSSYDKRFEKVEEKLEIVMDNFIDPSTYKHFFILGGKKIEADIAYQTIYSLADHTIHIIDDYIGIKTLHLLLSTNRDIQIIILSDNVSRNPVQPEYIEDFKKETGINLTMKPSNNRCHDRFVLIDYRTEKEKIYLCGSSSKDAGKRATTITEIKQDYINHAFFDELIK